ncbi:MAG: hypothetical protein A2Z02_03800 [Chloroflexi bacterium RBG_16_48_7]|nr:MAG: hypothetical protein A2Z02_03800 [Chloroflexi bacterium RBG_16_48_7]
METTTTSKVNQAISELEILKERIASVKSRYNILNEDYSRLCEDAIAVIAEYRNPQDSDAGEVITAVPVDEAVIESSDVTPVQYIEPQPAGCPSGDTVIPLAEHELASGIALGLAGESLGSMEGLEIKTSRAPSLEEIIAFQQRQLKMDYVIKKTAASKKKINAQTFVDIIGDGIESGLDKIGNGLMFPFVKIADLSRRHTASTGTTTPSGQH